MIKDIHEMTPAELKRKILSLENKITGYHVGLYYFPSHEVSLMKRKLDECKATLAHLEVRDQASSWVDGVGSGMEYTA